MHAAGFLAMETPTDYLKFAEECRRLAKQITSSEHKAILTEMAEVWLRLATEAERRGTKLTDCS